MIPGPGTRYADILLPFALAGYYTYKIPDSITDTIQKGRRVIIQFGKNKFFSGIIINIHNNKPSGFETKEIISVLDSGPVVTEKQLQLWEWIARYYMCAPGEVMKAALPSSLRFESETGIRKNENFTGFSNLSEQERIIFLAIRENKNLTVSKARKVSGKNNIFPLLNALFEKHAITFEEEISESYKPKFEIFIGLSDNYSDESVLGQVLDNLKKMRARYSLLLLYLELAVSRGKLVSKKEITGKMKNAPAAIRALINKGILTEQKIEVGRLTIDVHPEPVKTRLNNIQEAAFRSVLEGFATHDTALLHGVTSSGKTEIYIELIRKNIEAGKQVLYLLPEIALTAQVTVRLVAAFGDRLGVYHSKCGGPERFEIWNYVLYNKYQVILGARSAIFLPFQNLGLVIVDEEHETSYKQFDPAPRYHARDTAVMLAKIHGAKTLLGSATPSVESWHNAQMGKYAYIGLLKRFNEIPLPEVVLIDTRPVYSKKHMMSHFSPYLIENIKDALAKGEQVILFQNRRGFSPYLECVDCGWIPKCRQCNVSLTYHKISGILSCHYCGYAMKMVNTCKSCSSSNLQTKGFGTEKVEDEMKIYFPGAKIARLDLDTSKTKKDFERIIFGFADKEIDILIGTQMVTKGLNFDHVSVVGVLNADNMMNFPDYRAFERSFHLLVQVSGRAGRTGKQGKVIVQTGNPGHPVIKDFLYGDFRGFYGKQLAERKMYNYPPFSRLIRLTLKHRNEETLNEAARDMMNELKPVFAGQVLGPETPAVNKIQNYFLLNILVKLTKDKSLEVTKELIQRYISILLKKEKFRYLVIIPDVDPA